MPWNWELPDCHQFIVEILSIAGKEKGALLKTGELRHTRYTLNLG